MQIAGPAGLGLYVTDGTISVALLKFPGDVPGFSPGYHGLIHFGMWRSRRDRWGDRQARVSATCHSLSSL